MRFSRFKLSCYGLSDIGAARHNNEDACMLNQEHGLFILADGMGGHNAGEIASKETVHFITRSFEMFLEEYNKDINFNVHNFGVVGYSSIQELLNIRFNILSDFKKPDILIVMNGVNDYHHAFLSKENNFEGLLRTGLGTDKVLNYYWEFHNDKKLINTQNILKVFEAVFSNTITLSEKIRKYYLLKEANEDVDKFINEYLKKKQATFELVNNNLEKNNKYYLGNMKLIADFAKSHDIKVLFILQPILYEAEKIKYLVEQEITEYIHTQTGYFALEDDKEKTCGSWSTPALTDNKKR